MNLSSAVGREHIVCEGETVAQVFLVRHRGDLLHAAVKTVKGLREAGGDSLNLVARLACRGHQQIDRIMQIELGRLSHEVIDACAEDARQCGGLGGYESPRRAGPDSRRLSRRVCLGGCTGNVRVCSTGDGGCAGSTTGGRRARCCQTAGERGRTDVGLR